MVDTEGRNLAFILSTPRAGSSLLAALLGGHSEVFCPPEPWLLLSLGAVRSKDTMIVSHYDHELARRALGELVDDKLFHEAERAFLITIYNSLLRRHDKRLFVDKTPRYYHILPLIDVLFPLSRKIWIKRNPLDVIASYKTTWGHSVDELVGHPVSPHSFDSTVAFSLLSSYFEKEDSTKTCVSYEDLVRNPGAHLAALCRFLNLPFEEHMLNYGAHPGLLRAYGAAFMGDRKLLDHHRPHDRSVGAWRDLLTRRELELILQTFGLAMFKRLDYGHLFAEAAAMAGIPESAFSDEGAFDRMFARYRSYAGNDFLKSGSIAQTLMARHNSQLLDALADANNQRLRLEARAESSERQLEQVTHNLEAIRTDATKEIAGLEQQLEQQHRNLEQTVTTTQQETTALEQQLREQYHALARLRRHWETEAAGLKDEIRVLERELAERNKTLELSQRLTHDLYTPSGAAKVIVGKILRPLGLYDFGKRIEATLSPRRGTRRDPQPEIKTVSQEERTTILTDFIVAHCEINDRHGVGKLVKMLFSSQDGITSVRSKDLYNGEQSIGVSHFCISHSGLSRSDSLSRVRQTFATQNPRRILSIPYFTDDVITTLALKDTFGVPLCTYIMDDQNICVHNIPDDEMRELLQKSDLRFGISRALCDAYEKKYNLNFWFLPPTAPGMLVRDSPKVPDNDRLTSHRGILIGNIWSQNWLDRLRLVLRDSGIQIDWFGAPHREWLSFEEGSLAKDGITFKGFVSDETLVESLRDSPYAVVLTGTTEEAADRPELTKLSLPSRVPYIVATANTPIIVVGNRDSAVARFVEQNRLGVCAEYDRGSLSQAVNQICSFTVQEQIRERASQLARAFKADGLGDWIWTSLTQGKPCDDRFERLGTEVDVVVTLNEVNPRHGTGALVKRIFEDSSNICSIRSFDHYEGDQEFGTHSFCLPEHISGACDVSRHVSDALKGLVVKRVFCVPYHERELWVAMAVKNLYQATLATYVMDDQNVCVGNIRNDLMKQFLAECSLRLATHTELRDAYEAKYGLKFWLLPAVVPACLLQRSPRRVDEGLCQNRTGALIGSIWSKEWFDMLSRVLSVTGLSLDWFGNTDYWWQTSSPEELQRIGLMPYGILPEKDLATRLQEYSYAVVPTGTLDEKDDRPELSRLSLPGRIIFVLATANTPIIVLGSDNTSAGRFVRRFGIGTVCDYDPKSFAEAVEFITMPSIQSSMRQKPACMAENFSARGAGHWVWRSLDRGIPCDFKFEKLMATGTQPTGVRCR